ncbi:MAG: guanylate kinase [Mogibacterium sp.]|nr:guanylate kinase [Mogibacterium sp.]
MSRSRSKGKLFVISGPSGTGKGTICSAILERHDIDLSVSMTTRAPREGEQHGREYYFTTVEDFRENIEKGNLLEYAVVYENMYGTPKDAVMRKLERGRNVILEIDMQGALNIKRAMPESILIYILPPSLKVLRERLAKRGTDSEEVILKRSEKALSEIRLIGEYDYYVVNDDLETAVREVEAVIIAEGRRVPDKVMPIIRKYEEESRDLQQDPAR